MWFIEFGNLSRVTTSKEKAINYVKSVVKKDRATMRWEEEDENNNRIVFYEIFPNFEDKHYIMEIIIED